MDADYSRNIRYLTRSWRDFYGLAFIFLSNWLGYITSFDEIIGLLLIIIGLLAIIGGAYSLLQKNGA
jgi:hypothetical protein